MRPKWIVILIALVAIIVGAIILLPSIFKSRSHNAIERNYSQLRMPAECSLLSKHYDLGVVDSETTLWATYRCGSTASQLHDNLASTYNPASTSYEASFSSTPNDHYFFMLQSTDKQPTDSASEASFAAAASTNPVYCIVGVTAD